MSMPQENIKISSPLTTNDDAELTVSILQMDIKWEDKLQNLEKVRKYMSDISGKTDLLVLPEMFSTGFSMNCKNLAEESSGNTITQLRHWSIQYDIAICGSFCAIESGNYYNRGFFITQTQTCFYDKHHLFRMGDEANYFSPGNNVNIVEHKGFNLCLQICYDLRFPVWTRNVNNKYDLLIYVASWPQSRIRVWDTLLEARAIENVAYVCGVNRIGTDGHNLEYNGYSTLFDYRGDQLLTFEENKEDIRSVKIYKKKLNLFRNKFPVWKDADRFTLI